MDNSNQVHFSPSERKVKHLYLSRINSVFLRPLETLIAIFEQHSIQSREKRTIIRKQLPFARDLEGAQKSRVSFSAPLAFFAWKSKTLCIHLYFVVAIWLIVITVWHVGYYRQRDLSKTGGCLKNSNDVLQWSHRKDSYSYIEQIAPDSSIRKDGTWFWPTTSALYVSKIEFTPGVFLVCFKNVNIYLSPPPPQHPLFEEGRGAQSWV